MEAWTLQHEVVDSFRDADAPRAVRAWGKAHVVEVSGESCVAEAETREGDIQLAGRFSNGEESLLHWPIEVVCKTGVRDSFHMD